MNTTSDFEGVRLADIPFHKHGNRVLVGTDEKGCPLGCYEDSESVDSPVAEEVKD